MGRRIFLSHLASAKSPGTIPDIQSVDSVEEGLVACRFSYCQAESGASASVKIQLCATDLDEYPDGNSFMIYTDDESLDGVIPMTLQRLTSRAHGKPLSALLLELSETLTAAINGAVETPADFQDDGGIDDFEEPDLEFEEDSDIEFGFTETIPKSTDKPRLSSIKTPSSATPVDLAKIRADLTATKYAGFRVGVLGNLQTSGILCISIRIVKLGLSEEAMQAWNLQRKHYLVLMIRYPRGYRDIDQFKDDITVSGPIEMRVALCDHYKPQLKDALNSFQSTKSDMLSELAQGRDMLEGKSKLEPLFIDRPLNQLLRDFLPQIIKVRIGYGLSWLGAEQLVQARQVCASGDGLGDMSKYYSSNIATTANYPPVVMGDQMTDNDPDNLSLPLVAMQFVLRHFTRCTEFCLVCHCHIEDSFEALKPYVCSKPLCLYQYMSLGFGPSIEWEIISQPYVVDLLISFCYLAARNGSLKVLPHGMSFSVPLLPSYAQNFQQIGRHSPQKQLGAPVTPPPAIQESFSCIWRLDKSEISVKEDQYSKVQKLKPGSWIVLIAQTGTSVVHCQIEKVHLPLITLGRPVMVDQKVPVESWNATPGDTSSTVNTKNSVVGTATKCYVYDHNFDDLPDQYQHHAIATLLDTLPSVGDMRKYLDDRDQDSDLRSWKARISDSALALLRWIIASNRSCIMQVDQVGKDGTFITANSVEDRVGGMNEWIQFRFAQGAPDKEKRFLDCVSKEANPTSKFPTLFAWHGSNLRNWHSIIRKGLRFDDVVNGRAYGNGVYMSRDAMTSLTYSASAGSLTTYSGWKPSILHITNAFSLNEVVNRPDKFVSQAPHYVVADIDWIQTRYLFVKSSTPASFHGSPSTVYVQDPNLQAFNEQRKPIVIPITAISKSRRPATKLQSSDIGSLKRNKYIVGTDQATAEQLEDDANSVMSDADELALFVPDLVDDCEAALRNCGGLSSPVQSTSSRIRKRSVDDVDDTDFVPGNLDVSGIKFLEPPKDATPSATKALMRSFREALAVQEDTTLSKLGWYIDSNLVNNMYQWIVELHSFPAHLPLHKDMKAAKITSVVLEMRFSPNFPFTPPFIRVVKPRFLPFGQGGGGNVTEGGAMCMEVLTNNGWTAAQSMDALLLQVRMAMCDEERPARLGYKGHGKGRETYGIGEAVQAYIRACRNHGWTVPDGFEKLGQE